MYIHYIQLYIQKMEIEMVKFDAKGEKKSSILTSVRVSSDLFSLAKENNISFSEAMRSGIAILLADKGVEQYDNDLNLYKKMLYFKQMAEESLQKMHELTEKMEKTTQTTRVVKDDK